LAHSFRRRGDPIKPRFVLACIALSSAVCAQPLTTDAYRRNLQQGVERGVYRELAVGWIDGAQRDTWFFGRANKPNARSAFEIGAASEIFTGLLLAQAAYEGRVRLNTPIRELLPKNFTIADEALRAITLGALAMHHSGLPALPPNLFPANADDAFAQYGDADLLAFLASYRQSAAAKQTTYSVLDGGLLGYLLGRSYSQPFPTLLTAKILKPMGMNHSRFDDGTQLLQGHGHGRAVAHWHFGALSGAAGLRSTLDDLLGFMQQNLTPTKSPLRAALLLARQAQSNVPESEGLGWNIVQVDAAGQTWPLIWRASRTAGFSVFLGFRTDRQQALVLLGNTDADLSALGIAWLEQRPPPSVPDAPPSTPAGMDLAAYPGLYRIHDGGALIVRADPHGLSAQFPGQFPVALQAQAPDVFSARSAGFLLSFQHHAGKVDTAVLARGDTNVLASRLSDAAPTLERIALPMSDSVLHGYTGDYRLDDDTLLRIAQIASGLTLQWTGDAPRRLIAFAPDRFADARGCCELHFAHAKSGAVNGLTLTLAGIDRRARREDLGGLAAPR
jgi:CubicO group peptidase (beta-lactamase class C family)